MITEKDVLVCNFDVTPDSFIKPSALFRYYQQAARENIDAIGLTFEKMLERGVVFVLTRMKSSVYSEVKGYDVLKIKTTNRAIKGAVFTRDFVVYKGEELVAEAETQWALIDVNTRRLCRPSVYADYFDEGCELCSFTGARKLNFDFSLESSYFYTVTYSDTDENRHFNNTRYIDVCLDALGGIPEDKRIKDVLIDFVCESRQGDVLEVKFSRQGDEVLFEAFNASSDKISFRAKIVFTQKNAVH